MTRALLSTIETGGWRTAVLLLTCLNCVPPLEFWESWVHNKDEDDDDDDDDDD